ncbi:MAG: hypothetical protein QOI39_4457 [Mycobacterium sp.]|nr:hypothetical protein [Mycobacterium sp.]
MTQQAIKRTALAVRPRSRHHRAPTRIPGTVAVSGLAWTLLAIVDLWAGVDAIGDNAAKSGASQFGPVAGSGAGGVRPEDVACLVGGLLVLTAVGALFGGRAWVTYLLSGLGCCSVIGLAVGGHLSAGLAFGLLILCGALMMTASARQFLGAADTPAIAAPSPVIAARPPAAAQRRAALAAPVAPVAPATPVVSAAPAVPVQVPAAVAATPARRRPSPYPRPRPGL